MHQNEIQLRGVMADEPEWRTTQYGKRILILRLRTDRHWRDKSDKLQTTSNWHKVIVTSAAALDQSDVKRVMRDNIVAVTGELQYRSYFADKYKTIKAKASEIIVAYDRRGKIKILFSDAAEQEAQREDA